MTDAQLIELVEQYPVLYNKSMAQYRDLNVRNTAWEEIAAQMDIPVEEVKSKWGTLRNCFTNALKRRRKKCSQGATIMIPWRYEKELEFLKPYVEGRAFKNVSLNVSDNINDDDSTQDSELNMEQFSDQEEASPVNCTITPNSAGLWSASTVRASTSQYSPKRTKIQESDNFLTEMVNVMNSTVETRQKRAWADMDETDFFFLSMSKQLKTLPKTDQAEIKFQLHKLIHDSEMKMLNNSQSNVNTLKSDAPTNRQKRKHIEKREPSV